MTRIEEVRSERGAGPDEAVARPKVVLVGPSTRFLSGITYYTYGLARALVETCDLGVLLIRRLVPARLYPGGHRVGHQLSDITLPEVATFDGLDYFWGPSAFGALRFLRRERPDVLVLQWWTGTVLHSFLLLALAARRLGAAVVLEFHESLDPGERSYRLLSAYVRHLSPRLFSRCAAFVVHSEADRELVVASYRIEPSRIVVIPHPVYDHQLTAAPEHRDPGEVCSLLFFGLIRPVKGLDDLIAAVDLLDAEEAQQYSLTIVGETWEQCEPIVDLARASRHASRITIVNRYVSDAEADGFFRAADVAVLPYRSSSQSGVLHMAMGYGLPVVVTAVGGMIETASRYEGAELVEPENPAALLDGIRRARKLRPGSFSYAHRWTDSAVAYRALLDSVTLADATTAALKVKTTRSPAPVAFDAGTATSPSAPRRGPVGRPFWLWWLGLSIAAVGGTGLIGVAYRDSIVTGRPSFAAFWAGVLVFMVPTAVFVAKTRSRRGGLLTVTAASGLFLYIPKLLRNPFGPVYHDEIAHWRQVQDIVASGHLFVPNTTIPIIQDYPGLHIVTVTLQELTGMSTWSTAITLLATFHVVDLLAVFLIVEGFSHSARTGAIGALVYSLNSSFMYFDTQFAYESLGVLLFLLTVLAVQRVEQSRKGRARAGWSVVAVATASTCAVTHHLSTVCVCVVLVGWSLVAMLRRRRSAESAATARAVVAVTGSVLAIFAMWIAFVAPATIAYLRPYLGEGIAELSSLLSAGRGGRVLFGASGSSESPIPRYEELAAFVSPLVVLVATGATALHLRRRRLASPAIWRRRYPAGWYALSLFGLLYFVSLPFLLAPGGAEGARRSWAFSYLGIAVILAPTISRWLSSSRSIGRSRAVRAVLISLFVVLLVGNVAGGLDESSRFPGPYAVGSDTGSETPELAALSQWFPATVGVDNKVVSDRLTGLELGAFGQQLLDAPSAGFPTYQLWLDSSPPSPYLLNELSSSGYRYLVIDTQLTLPVSELAGFFNYDGAASSDGTEVVTRADLARFASYGWLSLVYDSNDFAVYRFQFASLGRTVGGS